MMKIILSLSMLAVALIVASSPFAQSSSTGPTYPYPPRHIYQSYSQGSQSYTNPDWDYFGEDARHPAQTW
jgi:hypothetical protein